MSTENTVEEDWLILQSLTWKATTPINNQVQALSSEKLDVWVVAHENVENNEKNTRALHPRSPDKLFTYYL